MKVKRFEVCCPFCGATEDFGLIKQEWPLTLRPWRVRCGHCFRFGERSVTPSGAWLRWERDAAKHAERRIAELRPPIVTMAPEKVVWFSVHDVYCGADFSPDKDGTGYGDVQERRGQKWSG